MVLYWLGLLLANCLTNIFPRVKSSLLSFKGVLLQVSVNVVSLVCKERAWILLRRYRCECSIFCVVRFKNFFSCLIVLFPSRVFMVAVNSVGVIVPTVLKFVRRVKAWGGSM